MTAQTRTNPRKTLNLKRFLIRVGCILGALYLCHILISQQRLINDNIQRTQEVRAQTAEAELRTAMLQEQLSQVDTDEFLIRVAREQLRFAMPSDRIFVDSARN